MQHTHDVIIVGAGIVGSAMALAAASDGLRVALLDKQTPSPVTEDLSLRVSNINYGSEQFLKTLGVTFPEQRRGIFKHIKILQAHQSQTLNFSTPFLDMPYLGSIIENNVLIDLMHTLLKSQPRVNCFFNASIQKFEINAASALVHVLEVGVMSAPLLISAEGTQSSLRQYCGIVQDEKHYGQTALVAHIALQQPHHETAYQRFLNTGPVAYLPLHDKQQCSIVWSSTPSHIDYLLTLDDKSFAVELANAMSYELGTVEIISKRACFPLVMRHAQHYIAPRTAFIGDAIHTLHPLAGQGANLGLMDVACLAQCIKAARQKNRDIGEHAELRPYERKRRLANTVMLQTVQLLAKNQQPFVGLRTFAMTWLERSAFLKRLMVQFAQGA